MFFFTLSIHGENNNEKPKEYIIHVPAYYDKKKMDLNVYDKPFKDEDFSDKVYLHERIDSKKKEEIESDESNKVIKDDKSNIDKYKVTKQKKEDNYKLIEIYEVENRSCRSWFLYSWSCLNPYYCFDYKNREVAKWAYPVLSLVSLSSWLYYNNQKSEYKKQLKENESYMVFSFITQNNYSLLYFSEKHSFFEQKTTNSINNKNNSVIAFFVVYSIGVLHSILVGKDDPWCYPFSCSLNIDKKPTPDPNRRMEDNYEISFKANF